MRTLHLAKDFIMSNLHVLMTQHTDIDCIMLLIAQLPFIKEQYETFVVESVPYGVKNKDVLKYLSNVSLTYVVDLTKINEQLGLSKTHLSALKNEYSASLTDEEKMQLKYEAVIEISNRTVNFEQDVKQVFYIYCYYHYLSEALKNGIELFGIEHPSYYPGAGKFQSIRDSSIVANTFEVMKEKQNALMLAGASHGVDLIKAYKQNETMKNSYTHLYCDNSDINTNSPSQLFKKDIESGNYSLTENQSYLYLNLAQKSMEEQSLAFQERVLATKSNKPVYHDYGRKPVQEKSAFCMALAKLGDLPFSMSIDKDYYADTTCTIDDKDKMKAANRIQEKAGIGTFFKNDKGVTVFAVKNTNVQANSETLRTAIRSLDSFG